MGADVPREGGSPMSITEIASTGLLRMVAPLSAESSATDVPDHALRAVALATLATSAGIVRPAQTQSPVRAVKPSAKTGKQVRLQVASGDYAARARGRGDRRPSDD